MARTPVARRRARAKPQRMGARCPAENASGVLIAALGTLKAYYMAVTRCPAELRRTLLA
jgi:hypothetical protein